MNLWIVLAIGCGQLMGVGEWAVLEDMVFKPVVSRPEYKMGEGPRVSIDEAHNNFHTASGLYKPFADLLRLDGYVVTGLAQTISEQSLKDTEILVIANALPASEAIDDTLLSSSAFTADEIDELLSWIREGGSLFLIVDHMPFPDAVGALAKELGVEFSNGFAKPLHRKEGEISDRFCAETGLMECVVTRGRNEEEIIDHVVTFFGSGFKCPKNATTVIVFGAGSVSQEPEEPWVFTEETPEQLIEGWSQIAIFELGKGRVAISGEAAMFTAREYPPNNRPLGMNSPHAEQNMQFLLNLMHWLSRAPGMIE